MTELEQAGGGGGRDKSEEDTLGIGLSPDNTSLLLLDSPDEGEGGEGGEGGEKGDEGEGGGEGEQGTRKLVAGGHQLEESDGLADVLSPACFDEGELDYDEEMETDREREEEEAGLGRAAEEGRKRRGSGEGEGEGEGGSGRAKREGDGGGDEEAVKARPVTAADVEEGEISSDEEGEIRGMYVGTCTKSKVSV